MTCPDCDRPMATDANLRSDDTPRPEDDLLCWRAFHGDRCQQPVDWRARCKALDAENTALVEQLFTQAAGRDIDAGFAASAQAGAEWQARRAEAAERQREARDAALDACQERIAGLLAERARFVAAFDEANANAPRALTDALAAITRIVGERDQARRDKARAVADALASQNATLQATVLGLLAVLHATRAVADDAVNLLAVETMAPMERSRWVEEMRERLASPAVSAPRPLDQAHVEVLRELRREAAAQQARAEADEYAPAWAVEESRARVDALSAVLGEEPSSV